MGIKLHIGCGRRQLKGWLHADMADFPHIDHKDIFNLPYQENTVSAIYSAHLIAYFSKEEALKLLKHWYAILKPGGTLRIATPNFKAIAELYSRGYEMETFTGLLYGRMEVNNGYIYHRQTYDFDSLSRLLESVGFKKVQKYKWQEFLPEGYDDHSRAVIPHMDFKNGTLMSLNVVCNK